MQAQTFALGEWNLTDALPSMEGPGLAKVLAAIETDVKRFESLRGSLSKATPAAVGDALRLYEGILDNVQRVTETGYMAYSVATADGTKKAFLDMAEETRAGVENRTLYFRLWWIGLDDESVRRLTPANLDHRHVLQTWRKLRPHTLGEEAEKVVNLKNTTGFLGWAHHYDKIASDFTYTLSVGGKPVKGRGGKAQKLVAEQVTRLFASPNPKMREAAYTALLGKYRENGQVLGEVYRTIVRDWRNENVKLRNYASPISTRNLENDVSDGAVETLLSSCRKNATVFHDFFRLKAKMLGSKGMARYHIYAPLISKDRRVSYPEAVRTVLDSFSAFDRRMGKLAQNTFEMKHVDSIPRKGKNGGAYCMSITPSVVPYLFLNFAGMSRDVYTIAHESGHAVHSQLSSSHSIMTFQPPLVLAETASVFGEMILFDKFMREEKDDEVKKAVIMEKVSSMYATIGRQANFVIFEKGAHDAVADGATVDDLTGRYLAGLREHFGSAVKVPDEFGWEWTYIHHIYHTPFYCYAYAFGNLLSLSLYETYRREWEKFVPKYVRMLSHGGSMSPGKVLAEVGVYLESARFWQSGFDVI